MVSSTDDKRPRSTESLSLTRAVNNVSRLQLHRRQISLPRQSTWRSLQSHTANWANEIGQLWHFFCVAMIHSSQWYTKFPFVEADCARGSSIKSTMLMIWFF
jgi:hypothetical protein